MQIVTWKEWQMCERETMPTTYTICYASKQELPHMQSTLQLPTSILQDVEQDNNSWFESFEGYDCMHLHMQAMHHKKPAHDICIFALPNLLLFLCDDIAWLARLKAQMHCDADAHCVGRVLYLLIDWLTNEDAKHIEGLEKHVVSLEENLLLKKVDQGYLKSFVLLRHELLSLKRFYEQLIDVLEEVLENQNEMIDARNMQRLHMLQKRSERMFDGVNHLRDFVTQTREAYQAQVDIRLNDIMKILTLITTVCLPLTLIVGWYGMNLQMPEFNWSFSYPVVILISISFVVGSIIVFKKSKWL